MPCGIMPCGINASGINARGINAPRIKLPRMKAAVDEKPCLPFSVCIVKAPLTTICLDMFFIDNQKN